jgi:hypothetical protein
VVSCQTWNLFPAGIYTRRKSVICAPPNHRKETFAHSITAEYCPTDV